MIPYSHLKFFLFFFLAHAGTHLAKGITIYIKNSVKYPNKIVHSPTVFAFTAYLFFAIIQYFLAIHWTLEHSLISTNTQYASPFVIVTSIIGVFCFVFMSHVIIPDLISSENQEILKSKSKKIHVEDYYRQNRRLLSISGFIYLFVIAINFKNFLPSSVNVPYWTHWFPFHFLYGLILILMYITPLKSRFFTVVHRSISILSVVLIVMIIFYLHPLLIDKG